MPATARRALRARPSPPTRLLFLAWSLLLAGCGGELPSPPPTPDVLLLITVDTLRADRLGAYGSPLGLTPNLDALAEESIVFEAAYAAAPFTLPSLSALMTGRHPQELGVFRNESMLPQTVPTLASELRNRGWGTHAVVSNFILRRASGIASGFDSFDDEFPQREAVRKWPERTAPDTTDAALAGLDGCTASADAPCFLWVHYQDPHGPYTPPDDLRARELAREADAPDASRQLPVSEDHIGIGGIPDYQLLDGRRDLGFYRAGYHAEIRYFDRELGRLLDELDREDLMDDALVVFTSDHGESLGERDYWFSHSQHLHSELVHVPFLVRYPEGVLRPAASEVDGYRRVTGLVSHLDVPPTILGAFGLDALPGYGEGLLAPELDPEKLVAHTGGGSFGLSDGRYRLIYSDGRAQLFDTSTDPDELHDLALERSARLRDMLDRHKAAVSRLPHLEVKGVAVEETAADLKALEALGYTGEE